MDERTFGFAVEWTFLRDFLDFFLVDLAEVVVHVELLFLVVGGRHDLADDFGHGVDLDDFWDDLGFNYKFHQIYNG